MAELAQPEQQQQQQQQQRQQHDHAWYGSNKTISQLMEERRAWVMSLPEGQTALRQLGMYFGHMEDVWDKVRCNVAQEGGHFAAIHRTQSQGRLYSSCYAHLENEIRDPDWTSGTANQHANSEKVDPVGNLGGESVHLMSHAKVCHRAYSFIAEAAIGISIEAMGLTGNKHTNRRKLLVGVKGGFHFTSLKGHKFNKMYWKLQAEHFDSDDPGLLVVPLLALPQIMDWAKDEMHAIEYDVAVFTFGARRQVVAGETLLYAKGTCTPAEIEIARENLTCFVKGIASHLLTRDVFESLQPEEKYFTSKNPSLVRWRELVKQLRAKPEIFIPTPLPEINASVRIAKARMTKGTSLPDPWLLLAKSAINYTASNSEKVMPACPPPVEEESDSGEEEEGGGGDQDGPEYSDENKNFEKMDVVREGFYHDALQRSGFFSGARTVV